MAGYAALMLTVLFAVFMIAAGVLHFVKPAMYLPFFPASWPGLLIIYASGVVEIFVGVCALLPATRARGAQAILTLMVLFLPLHVLDVFKDRPVVGSHAAAWIRLVMQFVLIAWAWYIARAPATVRR